MRAQSVPVAGIAAINLLNRLQWRWLFALACAGGCATVSAQTAYVPNLNSNMVSVIDTGTNTVTTTIPVGAQPRSAVVAPDGGHVYVVHQGGTMSVIATATNTVVATVPISGSAILISAAVSQDSKTVYVSGQNSSQVVAVSTATNTVTGTIPVTAAPSGLVMLPAQNGLAVAEYGFGTVSFIDIPSSTVVADLAVGRGPIDLALTPDGSTLYVANFNDATVSVVNARTKTVTTTIASPGFNRPNAITVSPDGKTVYVTNDGNATVSVISTATNTVTATIPVGSSPAGARVTLDGGTLYVPNSSSNSVSVIATATNTVSKTIPVGAYPLSFGAFLQNPPPTATAINPTHGLTAGGNTVTITGTNFYGATAVSFGGTAATSFTVNSNTSITATAPAHAAGMVDVIVTTPRATSPASAADKYTYTAPPTATQNIVSESLTQNRTPSGFIPVTGSGGTGPLSYSISPPLPAGLTYNNITGAIGGTPAIASPPRTYTVTVTDANSLTASNTFTLTVNPAVTATQAIASATLTAANFISPFTPVTGGGGTGTLTYGISPSLPSGLNFDSNSGAVSGTPSAASPATTYTVTVSDANGATASNTFNLIVNPPVTATQAVASTALTASHAAGAFMPVAGGGGTGTLTYGISPSLPSGLNFGSNSGVVSGTPSAASPATTYTVTVSDANGATASNTFALTVNPAVTATQAIASITLTANHSAGSFTPVTGGGGTGALSYGISPSLPSGLNFNSSSGAVGGTPSAASPATTYTVTVTDQIGATASNTFILTVNPAVTATQAVASATLTASHAASAFTPVTGSGGTGTLTYAISPALPSGLNFDSNSGAVSGTPSAASPATTYTVTVSDTNGATASNTFQLTVNGPLTATTTIPSIGLTVETTVSPVAPVIGAGGTAPLRYAVSPTLPPALSLNPATGILSGLPTVTTSTISYTVTVTDANGATATASFSLAVNGPVTASTAIPSTTLTQAQPSTAFTPVIGSGGTTPLSYSVAPALPAGLTMSSAGGAIGGSPTAISAATSYTVTVADAHGATAKASFTLGVNPAVTATLAIASRSLTYGTAAASFTPVIGGGGTGALTYGIAPALPSGLALSSAAGAIGGTPGAASAAANYTVTVTDANGSSASKIFSLAVGPAAQSLTFAAAPTIAVGGSGTVSVTSAAPNSGMPVMLSSTTSSVCTIVTTASAAGGATGTVSGASKGPCTIQANQAADAAGNYSAGSAALNFGIGIGSQTITFTSTPPTSPIVAGTYPVTATGGASGNPVTFSIDAASSSAACTIAGNLVTFTGAGTCIVDADQAGNANYAAASAQQTITIGKATSSVTLQSSANPSLFSHSVTFTATVTSAAGSLAPTDTVDFVDGTTTLCAAVALVHGVAICGTSALSVATHAIQANYRGNANTNASSSTVLNQVVGKDTTTMTLSVSPNPAAANQTITLTATVYGDPPSGTVTFYDGATVLGAVPLTASSAAASVATFSIGTLAPGTHTLSATYTGDANNQASASVVVAVAVNTPPVAAPMLDRWALLLLSGLLGAGVFLRRHRAERRID